MLVYLDDVEIGGDAVIMTRLYLARKVSPSITTKIEYSVTWPTQMPQTRLVKPVVRPAPNMAKPEK